MAARVRRPDGAPRLRLSSQHLRIFHFQFLDPVGGGAVPGARYRRNRDGGLKPAARVLVGDFTTEMDLTGEGVRSGADEPVVREGLADGRGGPVDADELEAAAAAARRGLSVEMSGEAVRVETLAPPARE